MKQGSTLFLRAAVIGMGLVVLTLSILILPVGIREGGNYSPVFWGMYLTTVPFFIALFQTWKLLDYVDKNTAFAQRSVKALQIIKYCAFSISAMYLIGMPFIHRAAEEEDAPGVLVLGLLFCFAPAVIGVFAAVLQKLLHSAIAIKSENDLTV